MVGKLPFGWKLKLFRVFDVSGRKLSSHGHPLPFCALRLFFAHAADARQNSSASPEFYFVIFNFCDVILIDAGVILRFGRNVNRWVV